MGDHREDSMEMFVWNTGKFIALLQAYSNEHFCNTFLCASSIVKGKQVILYKNKWLDKTKVLFYFDNMFTITLHPLTAQRETSLMLLLLPHVKHVLGYIAEEKSNLGVYEIVCYKLHAQYFRKTENNSAVHNTWKYNLANTDTVIWQS